MDLAAALEQFKPEPALSEWLGKLLEKTQNDALKIQQADLQIQQAALKTQHDALKIQALTFELAYYKRIRFANKSEAFTFDQRDLFDESWTADTSALEAEVEQSGSAQKSAKRERAGRQPLPEHLPRIEHRHELESCTCGQCGQDLVKIGEGVSEQLDVEPAKFFVHCHIRPQYACRSCETISAAPVPPAVIDGGMAAPGLLTWVMVSKFMDHLPLYPQGARRIRKALKRQRLRCTG